MLIKIETLHASPIYEQLRNQIVMGIASKELAHGEVLPSVRRLGADLGINFHTVNKAYAMLCDEGYIVMDRRKGAVVAQPKANDEAFVHTLNGKLELAVAEAVCHGITEAEFIAICKRYYKTIGGNKNA